jgi:hypothetical protein
MGGGRDRSDYCYYPFACLFSFSPCPNPLSHLCSLSQHSVAAMTYSQGHNLILGSPPNSSSDPLVPLGQAGRPVKQHLWTPLKGDLTTLTVFSRYLQRVRVSNGAIDLSQAEGGQLKFKLDLNGLPVEVSGSDHMEIHDTIAELMILANSEVSRIIYSEYPTATLFRTHTHPSLDRVREVQEMVRGMGIEGLFDGKTDEELLRQVREFKEKLGRRHYAVIPMVTGMVIRAMSEARYISSSSEVHSTPETIVALTSIHDNNKNIAFGGEEGKEGDGREGNRKKRLERIRHYGLGVEYYTHFTSPIRRYADVIVHRQLLSALERKLQRKQLRRCVQNSPQSNELIISSNGKKRLQEKFPVLPISNAVNIITEENYENRHVPTSAASQIHSSFAPDGRRLYEKVSSVTIADPGPAYAQTQTPVKDTASPREPPLTLLSTLSSLLPPLSSGGVGAEGENDLSLLDNLLSDVGEDLMESNRLAGQTAPLAGTSPL